MPVRRKMDAAAKMIEEWTLPSAATLGSSVRAKGILREVRAHLPLAAKKLLDIEVGALTLRMPEGAYGDFRTASAIVSKTLERIESLPVIPREVEDVLTISSAERHRWLKDGRLQSAGTRTVKLSGRARKITFHVFDPRHIEDVLDRDLVTVWREEDAIAAAENRRRAAGKAALKREQKRCRKAASAPDSTRDEMSRQKLKGWDEFERDGLLR
ncbi:hypothetical protein [Mesorhizobium sp.]|uniref:hypothetical protein n=1 Tax=Mesorhizobium sp. TaxID=1871066 RepID=UPI000FE712E8|nr:hypothetical protein [Mesorhizobium sp.]RWO54445.1 MAG: hypothetical protein EOS13_07735 [Mesorhizobium sp.]